MQGAQVVADEQLSESGWFDTVGFVGGDRTKQGSFRALRKGVARPGFVRVLDLTCPN